MGIWGVAELGRSAYPLHFHAAACLAALKRAMQSYNVPQLCMGDMNAYCYLHQLILTLMLELEQVLLWKHASLV